MSLKAFISAAILSFSIGSQAGDAAGNGDGRVFVEVSRWTKCETLPAVIEHLRSSGLPMVVENSSNERVLHARVQCWEPNDQALPAQKAREFAYYVETVLGAVNASRNGYCYVKVVFGRDFFGFEPEF